MAVKVAINGFGRIGRLAFRQMFEAEGWGCCRIRLFLRENQDRIHGFLFHNVTKVSMT